MTVLQITPHVSSEIDPRQLEPFRGIHAELDDNDPSYALLEIENFRTLRTLEHLMGHVVEVSPDTLTFLEEQKAAKLKNKLRADVDATLDGEHEDGPYRYNVEVDEANVVLHVIALKIEKEAEKYQAMLKDDRPPVEAYAWLKDRNAPNQPGVVAQNARHDVRDTKSPQDTWFAS